MSSSFELSSEEELNSMHANRKRSTKPDIASTYFDQRITIPRDGEEAEVSFFVFVFCFCIMVKSVTKVYKFLILDFHFKEKHPSAL